MWVRVARAPRSRAGVGSQAWELPLHTLPTVVERLPILPRPGVKCVSTLPPGACGGYGEAVLLRRKRPTRVEMKGKVFWMVPAGVKTWGVGGDQAPARQQTAGFRDQERRRGRRQEGILRAGPVIRRGQGSP